MASHVRSSVTSKVSRLVFAASDTLAIELRSRMWHRRKALAVNSVATTKQILVTGIPKTLRKQTDPLAVNENACSPVPVGFSQSDRRTDLSVRLLDLGSRETLEPTPSRGLSLGQPNLVFGYLATLPQLDRRWCPPKSLKAAYQIDCTLDLPPQAEIHRGQARSRHSPRECISPLRPIRR